MTQEDVTFLGYQVSCRGLAGDISLTRTLMASSSKGRYMACANPHSLVIASRDQTFSKALKNADILLPDGKGIEMASRLLGLPILQRVAGIDFFFELTKSLSEDKGARYFFLGSTDHVLKLITERLRRDFPKIIVCGTLSPPFCTEFSAHENFEMISAVNAANPDVLWVGMTAPKQEKWIYKNREDLQVPFICAIGAVFDYYAGTKKRASVYWQKCGMEWLPRFLSEPKRLWRRYFISLPIYCYWIAKKMTRRY